jgi:hypothetical protein
VLHRLLVSHPELRGERRGVDGGDVGQRSIHIDFNEAANATSSGISFIMR